MEELLTQLIDFVKNASPLVWEVLMKQVQVQIIQHTVWAVVAASLSISSLIIARKSYVKLQDRDITYNTRELCEVGVPVGIVAAVLLFLVGVVLVVGIASRIMNPEFYAIQIIIHQLTAALNR